MSKPLKKSTTVLPSPPKVALKNRTRILFVCLGNICRSPSAEAVFADILTKSQVLDQFVIDSAGTAGYHIGAKADARMRHHAKQRGIAITSRGRKLESSDFEYFDYIVGMDDSNITNIRALQERSEGDAKVVKMTDYAQKMTYTEVPDPYYGGEEGFELVLDILDDSCSGFLNHLQSL